jgi:hypothetical protein
MVALAAVIMVALATEDFGVETKCEFPQGLKPNSSRTRNGTAEEAAVYSYRNR